MSEGVTRVYVKNNLILPEQPFSDVFLQVVTNVFKYSCLFGVMGSKRIVWRIWSIIIFIILMIVQGLAIRNVIKNVCGTAIDISRERSITARLAGTFLYAVSVLTLILLSKLSLSWEEMSAYWMLVEKSVTFNLPPDHLLKKRLIIVICFMTSFWTLERLMSAASIVGFDCPVYEILQKHTLLSHGFMTSKEEYSDWIGIFVIFTSTTAAALWNFQDLIIILISMGLASRYHRLNKYLAHVCVLEKTKMLRDSEKEALRLYTWRKIREAYAKQATLVRKFDDALGSIIVLTNMCNFYYICLNLFLTLTISSKITILRKLYLMVSLTWLCIRIVGVVLAASEIHLHSKIALKYIYDFNVQGFNIEMERLQNQLARDNVGLSGMGFFYLHKNILLQMAGALITYELILIQFDDDGYIDVLAPANGTQT